MVIRIGKRCKNMCENIELVGAELDCVSKAKYLDVYIVLAKLSEYLSVCLMYACMSVSVYLYVCMSFFQSVCTSVCLSVCLSVSVCLFGRISIRKLLLPSFVFIFFTRKYRAACTAPPPLPHAH